MLSGQISFKKYSAIDIEKQSQERFQKYFKWKHYRIGCETDFMDSYLKMEAYSNFYQCLEDEIKQEINSQLEEKCKKHTLKEHIRCYQEQKCNWCDEFKILKQCTPRVEW